MGNVLNVSAGRIKISLRRHSRPPDDYWTVHSFNGTKFTFVHLRFIDIIISLFRERPPPVRKEKKKKNQNEIEFPAKRLRGNGCYSVAWACACKTQEGPFRQGLGTTTTPVDHRSDACVIVVVSCRRVVVLNALPSSCYLVSVVTTIKTP